MEQILHQILSTASTVILPHFGAIIKLGESYQFNEFLKYNDGKLTKAVEEAKSVSSEEATEIVSDYIRSIKESLHADKDFNLGVIGIFSKKGDKVIIKKSDNSATAKKATSTKTTKKDITSTSKVTSIPPKKETATTPLDQKETPKIDILKKEPKIASPTIKKEDLPKAYTSTNLVVDKAIEKIKILTSEKEITAFIKNEKRAQILTIAEKKIESFKSPKVKSIPVIKKEEKTPIVTSEEKKEPKKAETSESKKPNKEKITTIVTPTPKEEKKPIEKKEAVKATPIVKAKSTKKEEIKTSEEEIKNALKSGAIVIEKEAKKRKRRRLILWVAILLLLIGSSIIGYLKKNELFAMLNKTEIAEHKDAANSKHSGNNHGDKQKHLSNSEQNHSSKSEHKDTHQTTSEQEDAEQPNANENIAEESTNETTSSEEDIVEEITEEVKPAEEEDIVEEVEVIEENKPVAKGKYNIVVGSFSKKSNANKLVQKLNEEGYSNAKLIGKYGGLHAVSIDNFESRSDAKSALSDIKAKGYSGWIKKI